MVSPLLFLSRMAASRKHLSHVLYPAPTAAEFHIVDVWALSYPDLCPYPSLDPGHDPYHGLVGEGRRVDVYGAYNLAHLVSCSIPEKEDAYPWGQVLHRCCSRP